MAAAPGVVAAVERAPPPSPALAPAHEAEPALAPAPALEPAPEPEPEPVAAAVPVAVVAAPVPSAALAARERGTAGDGAARKGDRRERRSTRSRRSRRTLAAVTASPEAGPGSARQAYERGNALLIRGDAAGAIEAYGRAVSADTKDPAGYRGLGLSHAQLGQTVEALRWLRQYLKMAPEAPDRHLIARRIRFLAALP